MIGRRPGSTSASTCPMAPREGPANAGTSGEAAPTTTGSDRVLHPEPERLQVDIFQARKVIHNVRLNADGSAHVVQTAEVTNNAPTTERRCPGARATPPGGPSTGTSSYCRPVRRMKLAANPGQIKQDERVFTDVDGREAVRVVDGSRQVNPAS